MMNSKTPRQVRLLVIDPQNDFCSIAAESALYVPGADRDMERLATLVREAAGHIDDLVITLDSHGTTGIERTSSWRTADGDEVAPFTPIRYEDILEGRYRPAAATRGEDKLLLLRTLHYTKALRERGQKQLIAWPVHCVVGTWGHNIAEPFATEVRAWEIAQQRNAHKVLKGLNPYTEHYSALQAEVPLGTDPHTQWNHALFNRITQGLDNSLVLIAGEASSHCVAATVIDLLGELYKSAPADCLRRLILLSDCMSPVPGHEGAAEGFFHKAKEYGVRVMDSKSTLQGLRSGGIWS